MGILEDIVASPLLIGSITVTALVIYLRSAEVAEAGGGRLADIAESIGGAIQKPFSWFGSRTEDFTSWASGAIDSALISPSELPDWLKALRRK